MLARVEGISATVATQPWMIMEAPHVASQQNRLIWEQHSTGGRPSDIVLWGRPEVAPSRAVRDVDIQLYGVAPAEGVVVNNPTRSAIETASAKD